MIWDEFDDSVKQQLLEEDREAWAAICFILGAIILVGLCIAVLALVIIT